MKGFYKVEVILMNDKDRVRSKRSMVFVAEQHASQTELIDSHELDVKDFFKVLESKYPQNLQA
jgi:hypothetical protein